MRILAPALFAPALLLACAGPQRAGSTDTTTAAESSAAGLGFIEDDYPKALALAKSRGVPLFVDSWAPW